jgi:hypothetical protein
VAAACTKYEIDEDDEDDEDAPPWDTANGLRDAPVPPCCSCRRLEFYRGSKNSDQGASLAS